MDKRKPQWEDSYSNRDNFLFYPHEEVIRFVSKYIRKRVGLSEFLDIYPCEPRPRLLDLGCGIGRHVIYAHDIGLDGYGIDLSENAVKLALGWAAQRGVPDPSGRIIQGDVSSLPWDDGYFQFIVSHGVLDSMGFETAKEAVAESHRVLGKGGLFYCDLVSGDDSAHYREFAEEETVTTRHEFNTVQSYFNHCKVKELFGDSFEILEAVLIRRENVLAPGFSSRYHLVLKRNS